MITRSDVRIYRCSPVDFSSLISKMDDYPMYHSETSYNEAKFPESFYELSQDADSNIKEENTSVEICRIVDDMLTSNSTSDHGFSHSTEPKEEASHVSSKKSNTSSDASPNSEKMIMLTKDELDLKEDEFGPFSYSGQDIQSEPIVISDKFSNSFSHLDKNHCSSPYSETKMDSEVNLIKPTCLEQRSYDTSSLMYDNDDMTTFSGLVNCNEVLKNHKRKDISNVKDETFVGCYRSGSSCTSDEGSVSHNEQAEKMCVERSESYFSSQDMSPEDMDSRKGKISGLQRRALDSIFNVIDRPSRGLVLHIAGELCLHHITVKNFFSNGRRRLRRAAARLNDPERTRRENQKRKEKRRLAALAAAASAANGEKGGSSFTKGSLEGGNDSQSPREPPILSPERRALMEKLAVKVQRSVAQKGGLASGIGDSACLPASLASSAMRNPPINISSKNLDNGTSSQLHSNPVNINEPSKAFAIQQVEESFLNQDGGEKFSAMFSYSEGEPMTSYDSSPDQNSVSNYSSEQESTNSYALEGPYSPTSWQTLLHT